MNTKELLALGVFGSGSRLSERVAMLMNRPRAAGISRAGIGVCVTVLATVLLAGALAPRVIAQKLEFGVASIRAVPAGAHAEATVNISGANLTLERQSVKDLLEWAYGMEAWRISGPAWLNSQDFDIRAKAARPASPEQLRAMLQTLLEDRFKLVLHRETKITPVYVLGVGKDGPKMRKVDEEPRQGGRMGWSDSVFMYDMVNHVSRLAELLPDFLDERPVQDRTGLGGVYEISLRVPLDPEQLKHVPQPGAVFKGFGYSSGVFDAVEKLGLRLESTKAPAEFMVVDRGEKPNEN